jgi:hypothetical protein
VDPEIRVDEVSAPVGADGLEKPPGCRCAWEEGEWGGFALWGGEGFCGLLVAVAGREKEWPQHGPEGGSEGKKRPLWLEVEDQLGDRRFA